MCDSGSNTGAKNKIQSFLKALHTINGWAISSDFPTAFFFICLLFPFTENRLFIIEYILIKAYAPSTPPRSSSLPVLFVSTPFLSLIKKQTGT